MTKADIFNRIKAQSDAQREVGEKLTEVIMSPSVSADATAIATLLNTINATIFDTMNTLAFILCEMMVEEIHEKAPEPRKGEHDCTCLMPPCRSCLCNSCSNDHGSDENRHACCVEHGLDCTVTECPDYVKEEHK